MSKIFPSNDIWGKIFDHKSFTIFSIKPLEIWLNILYGHITYKGYEICATIQGYYTNCVRKMCQVYNGVQDS